MNATIEAWIGVQVITAHAATVLRRRQCLVGDRGEGVISTAIAVLIIAFLGAGMWVGFNTIWDGAETRIGNQVDSIG